MAYRWGGIPGDEEIVKSGDLMEGIARTELFVNQGIGGESFRDPDPVINPNKKGRPGHTHEGYIDRRHIFKPDFYAAPSPRMEAVSSQVHWRTTGHSHPEGVIFTPTTSGSGWNAIPGTATRLKIRDHARVFFMATFYCFEFGGLSYPKGIGGDASFGSFYNNHHELGGETRRSGSVGLAIHGKDGITADVMSSTIRRIYTSHLWPCGTALDSGVSLQGEGFVLVNMLSRHQHNIIFTMKVDPGIYDIGLVFSCRQQATVPGTGNAIRSADIDFEGGTIPKGKTVFFNARNMVCDVNYTLRAQAEDELLGWRTANPDDPQAI